MQVRAHRPPRDPTGSGPGRTATRCAPRLRAQEPASATTQQVHCCGVGEATESLLGTLHCSCSRRRHHAAQRNRLGPCDAQDQGSSWFATYLHEPPCRPAPLLALAHMQVSREVTLAHAALPDLDRTVRRGMPVAAPTMPQAHTMNARRLGAPTRRMSRFAGNCASGQSFGGAQQDAFV